MAKLENMIQQILDNAKKEADSILSEANKEKEAYLAKIEAEKNDEIARIKRTTENESARTRERVISSAELSARNEELTERQKIMNRVYLGAKEDLNAMSDEDYKNYLVGTVKAIDTKIDGISVPESRKAALGKSVEGIEIKADDDIDGFSLEAGNIVLNYRFNALIDAHREETEAEIRDILFGKEA